jgi:hypothetical protein
MVIEKDIFLSAQLLIKEHGSKAEDYAHGQWKKLIAMDDVKRASCWFRIISAIADLNNLRAQGKLH